MIFSATGKEASGDALAFLKGAVGNPWKAQAGAKESMARFLGEKNGDKNAIKYMPNVLAPLLFTKEKAKARWGIVKDSADRCKINLKSRLYSGGWKREKDDSQSYQATESLLEPKLRPVLVEYINLGIKENFYGNGHTGWLSSIYKSRKNLAEKIYFLRARPIAKSMGVDATRRAQYWYKNAARDAERKNKTRTRKARRAVLGKLDIKRKIIKKISGKSDPYGIKQSGEYSIGDLNYMGFWGGLWAVHQEKAFAKTTRYISPLLNLIVACKKYKRARAWLACTPALLRRLYWGEAVEAAAFQKLAGKRHLRYSAWTQKAVGRKYKYMPAASDAAKPSLILDSDSNSSFEDSTEEFMDGDVF